MPESRVDRLEGRVDQLEKKIDEVYQDMSVGFAEHRQLLIDQVDRLRDEMNRGFGAVRSEMHSGFTRVDTRLDRMDDRFRRLDAKLDAFIETQSIVNRAILERLERLP
jgi:16S rRNA C1402 N4-methylase RsmH